ncbi:NAD(P)-binding protein [Roseospirillum parvum]|uniref:NADPH-dependent glutamate synthase beta chain n=1 Tax=Roseospirillum parvum TaxID=83401 RepID=A0A1G7W1P3_9PROT|nr:NAD(P)-binding protein [Roseospirillum parvum]SDG65788.1 NADPH-dependent glutamate synthase beta chain [Roseospirillum parvum]
MSSQTLADTPPQGRSWRRFKEGETAFKRWTEQIFVGDSSHKCPTYVHRTPPCQAGCPSGHDIRGWLQVVRGLEKPPARADGSPMPWQEYAFLKMVAANPFPAIMGRVCPAPCEDGCNRNQVDDFVGINAVEHMVGDWAIAHGLKLPEPPPLSGKKVAVVGGGPAGLAAAYHLRQKGHAATIFEAEETLGGWMRHGIPGYRTPRQVLDAEIGRILALDGIEAKTGVRIGRDIPLATLEAEYDAVFWGIGTQRGRGLPIEGWANTPNCISGVDFLRAFNQGRLKHVSRRIIVVGGGDTSIDVASVARRLGHITEVHEKDRPENVILGQTAHDVATSARRQGAEVVLTSLFPVEQMTAAEREVRDATHEGVSIRGGIMPLAVLHDGNGRARALRLCECTMDGTRPVPVAGTEFELEADLIVSAIGQGGDMEGLEELDNGKGFIDADRTYRVKGRDRHFVGGDVVRPHLLTTAVGHGRVAAQSIDGMLAGTPAGRRPKVDVHHFNLLALLRAQGRAPEPAPAEAVRGTNEATFAVHNFEDRAAKEIITHEGLFLGHFPDVERHRRDEMQVDEAAVIGHFDERLKALGDDAAIAEAKRCMSCGLCFECDNCVIFCPQDAVHRVRKAERAVGRYVETDYNRCVGCHICHDVCPTGYIQMGLGEE